MKLLGSGGQIVGLETTCINVLGSQPIPLMSVLETAEPLSAYTSSGVIPFKPSVIVRSLMLNIAALTASAQQFARKAWSSWEEATRSTNDGSKPTLGNSVPLMHTRGCWPGTEISNDRHNY